MNDFFPAQTGALKDPELWEAHRKAYEMIYQLRGEIEKLKAAPQAKAPAPQSQAPSTSATTINGLFVKAVTPLNGQKLTYNSSTGQIEWQ